MFRVLVIATLLVGCRVTLEDEESGITGFPRCTDDLTSQQCASAAGHSELSWIQSNVFVTCASSICHDGTATKLDLRNGRSFDALVNKPSNIESSRTLVVPNDVRSSYLMLMLGFHAAADATPPGELPEAGYMPQGQRPLCCEKLEAIERWINAGAPNN